MKKAIVFIDGSNWYFKLKKILEPEDLKPRVEFDLRAFATELVSPDKIADIRYYIGKVKRVRGDTKSEKLYAKQQQLIGHLQQQKISVEYGHLISYPNGKFHEKGVDVNLAVEMIKYALENAYDVAYLISSDTDLVPAVKECKRLNKKVIYVGSSVHGQSFGLTKVCDKTVLLQAKDILPYMPKTLF